jgi:1-acyl-sn-glycerol-3-phosphate acyltransferase
MPLYSIVPYSSPENKNQTHLSPMTYDELLDQLKAPAYTWYQRVFQIVCFFVFLGPLRILLLMISIIVVSSIAFTLRFIFVSLGYDTSRLLFSWPLLRYGVRAFIAAFGIVWTNSEGELDPKSRILICNHIGFLDPLCFIGRWKVTFMAKKEFASIGVLRTLIDCLHPLYVDRTKSCGATGQIKNHAKNSDEWPLMIYPEGTIAGGDFMLRFHRGGFLTNCQLQPVVLRLITPLLPKRWNSHLWADQSGLGLLWQMLSMPFTICWIKWMKPIAGGEEQVDAEQFAERTQLLMANELGVKAVDIGSDSLFHQKYCVQKANENADGVIRRECQTST